MIDGEEPDHCVELALVPILVDLPPHVDDLALAEGELPRRLTDEVVERPGVEPGLGRAGPRFHAAARRHFVKVVVAVERDRRLL